MEVRTRVSVEVTLHDHKKIVGVGSKTRVKTVSKVIDHDAHDTTCEVMNEFDLFWLIRQALENANSFRGKMRVIREKEGEK